MMYNYMIIGLLLIQLVYILLLGPVFIHFFTKKTYKPQQNLIYFSVGHQKMLEFICDKTATPYFSNLIWLIGKDAIELDDCVMQESE